MEKYIPEKLRRDCYFDWVRVRRCATNKIGDAFSTYLNVSRTIEDVEVSEQDMIEQYEGYMNKKLELIRKELKLEPEEGEGEAEEGEGEEAEEEPEEKTEDEAVEESGENAAEEANESNEQNEAKDDNEVHEGDKQNLALTENTEE
jgi:hypothetical protein